MHNKTILIGNLGSDPEKRYTPEGTAVTNFSVATNETYTDNDGNKVTNTTWFRVSVWGKAADSCHEYLKRGSQVYVEGKLKADPNTGGPKLYRRGDGTIGASFEMTADFVRFLSSPNGESSEDIPY